MTDRIHPIAEWTSLVAYIHTRGLTAAGRAEAAPTHVLLVCGVWHVTLSHLVILTLKKFLIPILQIPLVI